MSHNTGRVVPLGTRIGPDSGAAPGAPGVWTHAFTPGPAPGGGSPRFVILNFAAMSFPAGARLEVDLRYDVDRFDGASGSDAWSRPIDPLPGPITIRYFGSGGAGGVTLARYGSGEPTLTGTLHTFDGSLTNPDLFLHTNPYTEPTYETRLRCGIFDWQQAACAAAGSPPADAARAVCVLVMAHYHPGSTIPELSTCSGTLIDSDLVLTAGHCLTAPDDLELRSGSVCFDYGTTCGGARPAGYSPRFHKIRRIVRRGTADWLILQIETPPGGLGIAPRPLRSAGAMALETVHAIHHPHGAVKKLQTRTLAAATVAPVQGFDFAGGSSGSALFDAAGQVLAGALSYGPVNNDACQAVYVAARTILDELAVPPAVPTPFDVMLVMDRSGSMSSAGTSPGRTKMDEARDAASLFVQLVRLNGGDQMGMVSFSTTARRPAETSLGNVNVGKKNQLVGPAPYTAGTIGALTPDAMTSIGDGLIAAMESLVTGANQRAILLMTDGLQNTAPMIAAAEATLGNTRVNVVGFGTEAQLNGGLLTTLARNHGGIYTRANHGLELKKFFSLAFGNIFESGTLSDPDRVLTRTEQQAAPLSFDVCEESRVTAIVGWDDPAQQLDVSVRAPSGTVITAASAGVHADQGLTWRFLRVELPHGADRAGTWQLLVSRPLAGEFPPPRSDVRYFVTIIADGGPRLEAIPPGRRVYTGDAITPRVALRYPDGRVPRGVVVLDVEFPGVALGTLAIDAGPAAPAVAGDPVGAFHAALQSVADNAGVLPLALQTRTVELLDDGAHEDGAMEPDGIYALPLTDLTQYEGNYTFHARAKFGDGCTSTREAFWSVAVELGIDGERSEVDLRNVRDAGSGRRGTIRVFPRDRYGSPLGPGRGDAFDVTAPGGTTVIGPARDNGDGSYDVNVGWDPAAGSEPGLVVTQPERPPVVMTPSRRDKGCRRWLVWLLLLLVLALLVVLAVVLSA
jgi:hypothetical protein